jgi:hypothetical protein
VRQCGERGSAIVEFALVALVLSLLLATTIDFGRLMFSAQQIQDVARVAARELAVTPLPANITFEAALTYLDPNTGQSPVLERIFNPACLVVDVDNFATAEDVEQFFAQMPLVNKALRPLMIADHPGDPPANLLRYPGALLASGTPGATCAGQPAPFTVGIPRVLARGSNGEETIDWVPILEEIRANPDPTTGPFSLTVNGIVALRINYPYQAAAMSGFQTKDRSEFDPNLDNVIVADDSFNTPPPDGIGSLLPDPAPGDRSYVGPYAGRYGLGRQLAFAKPQGVRPFRKLLAAQAIYRREVFQ